MFGNCKNEILSSAQVAVGQCLAVKPKEQVLIVTDPVCRTVAEALYQATLEKEAEPIFLLMEPREAIGSEPPPLVAQAIRAADVAFLPVSKSLTHTVARRKATETGTRIASLPGITEDIMARAVGTDYKNIADLTRKLSRIMENQETVVITAAAGTDLTMKITGRPLIEDTGLYTEPGEWGNLPAGEVYVAPIEGSANGHLVVDGSLAGIGLLTSPVTVEIRDGLAVSFSGGSEAERLREILDQAGPEGRNVAELGIGTNTSARLSGNILEDEKVLGTIHVAFGANASFGGRVQVGCHIDGIVLKPTLHIGDRPILIEGEVLFDHPTS